MDLTSRTPQTAAPAAHVAQPAATNTKRGPSDGGKWARIGVVALVAAIALLLLFLIGWLIFGVSNTKEDKYVDSNKLQAIFLSTGQVYFGNVTTMNDRYTVLTNIYYLQTSSSDSSKSSTSSNNVSLVKLGCELHAPYDQMVINRSQITFWENLQDNGQVATAVKTFQKDNPNGQKCSDQSSSSSTSSTNATQGATNSGTSNANSSNSSSTNKQ